MLRASLLLAQRCAGGVGWSFGDIAGLCIAVHGGGGAVIDLNDSNLDAGIAFCENHCVDREFFLVIGFLLFALLGLVYGGLAGYFYFRWERNEDTPRVPVAMVAFALQYGLVFTIAILGRYALLPTILLFLAIIALITVIRLGLQAHSKAGFRIALAGLFTLGSYICKMVIEYHEFARFYR